MFASLAALLLAMPVVAQAQTSAFDGTYAGVSTRVSKATPEAQKCPAGGVPLPFAVANGVVKSASGRGWTGTVSPQSVVTMQNRRAMHVKAQIDPQGNVTGQYHGPQCIVDYVWRRQAG
jgi:hypothetical protein